MIRVWFDFPTEDRPSVEAYVDAVPCIGDTVGIVLNAPPNEQYRRLDRVLDVRHYPRAVEWGVDASPPETRILLG